MASWGYRVGAALTDWGAALIAAFCAGLLVGLAGGGRHAAGVAGFIASVSFWLVNVVLIAGLSDGQTVGKKLARIRVVRETGQPYTVGTAFLRDVVGRLIWLIPFVALVDVLIPLGDKHRTLRDRMVDTRVTRLDAYESRRWPLTAAALATAVVLVASTAYSLSQSTRPVAGAKPGYTKADRTLFVRGCTSAGNATSTTCSCAFDYIARHLPYADYQAANTTADATKWAPHTSQVVSDAMTGCR